MSTIQIFPFFSQMFLFYLYFQRVEDFGQPQFEIIEVIFSENKFFLKKKLFPTRTEKKRNWNNHDWREVTASLLLARRSSDEYLRTSTPIARKIFACRCPMLNNSTKSCKEIKNAKIAAKVLLIITLNAGTCVWRLTHDNCLKSSPSPAIAYINLNKRTTDHQLQFQEMKRLKYQTNSRDCLIFYMLHESMQANFIQNMGNSGSKHGIRSKIAF